MRIGKNNGNKKSSRAKSHGHGGGKAKRAYGIKKGLSRKSHRM
jgi:hypothetical protein